jgi:ribonuclease VapC
MVIDTSALLAILFAEPEAGRLVAAISSDPSRVVGAPTLVETAAVMLARKGPPGEIALDALIQRVGIRIEPMAPAAASFARSAYARFGKGVGSPAVLNFGDCLAYGMAAALREPLLYKGDDFRQTDIPAAPF